MDMTVGDGRRCSAARAYLRPAMRRPNLSVLTHALGERIVFEGRRAVGVRYRRGERSERVAARREVILSAGRICSPQLLKLSGVGPAEELRAHGIEVVHALPGVGENLQDHLEFYFQMACLEPVTLYSSLDPLSRFRIGVALAAAPRRPRRQQSFRDREHSSAAVPASVTRTSSTTSCRWP